MMLSPTTAVGACLTLACLLPAQVDRFGASCSGDAGRVPRLTAERVAVQGSAIDVAIVTDTPRAAMVLVFGTSNSRWNSQALPLDLTGMGFAGCSLLVSPDALVAATADGAGRYRAQLPTAGLPVGQRGYIQVFVPGSAPGTWAFSDGLGLEVIAPLANHTVVGLPDTQIYSFSTTYFPLFQAQTAGIVQALKSRNIVFVSHVGDIVENGGQGPSRNAEEWQRADTAMSALDGDLQSNKDGLVPYATCIGNHDYDVPHDQSAAGRYLEFFGPARYRGRSWYLGASPNGRSHAQLFKAGEQQYLHLAIEWRAWDDALLWAQGVLAARPHTPTIVTTHEHLRPGYQHIRAYQGHTPQSGGSNSGEDAYRKLIEPFPQIFLVTCGHKDGEGQLTTPSIFGRTVHELLANYQFEPNGGNGWLRFMEFQPARNAIEVRTESTFYRPNSTPGPDHSVAASSNFTLAYDAYEHRAFLGSHRVRRFRAGQDFGFGNYTGAEDATVSPATPDTPDGLGPNVWCDDDGNREQGLLRFRNIVGTGAGQVPPRVRVFRAILTLTTEGSGVESVDGGKLYAMTSDWNGASTFNSLGGGVRIGVNTLGGFDVDSKGRVTATGTWSFDVTARVQAWVDGSMPNHGWAVIASGGDAWGVRSAEWGTIVERPMLTIVY